MRIEIPSGRLVVAVLLAFFIVAGSLYGAELRHGELIPDRLRPVLAVWVGKDLGVLPISAMQGSINRGYWTFQLEDGWLEVPLLHPVCSATSLYGDLGEVVVTLSFDNTRPGSEVLYSGRPGPWPCRGPKPVELVP